MNTFRLLSPHSVGMLGAATFLLIFTLSPIEPKVDLTISTVCYFVVLYVMFFVGVVIYQLLPKRSYRFVGVERQAQSFVFQFKLSVLLALLGIAIRLIDRFLIRQVSIFQSSMENRELLEQGGGGMLSVTGAILYPVCFLVLFFCLKLPSVGRNGLLLAYLLFFFPTFDSLLFGSRSLILVNAFMYLLILYTTGKVKVKLLTLILVFSSTFLLVMLSGSIFLSRLDEMGLNVLDTIFYSGYAQTVPPNEWVVGQLSSGVSLINTMLFSWLNFCQYYVHGLFEFNGYMHSVQDAYSYGATQYNVIYKFLAMVLPLPSLEIVLEGVNPRPGVFTTFFGPSHMDFGYFSLFYMLIFGVFASWLYRKVSFSGSHYAVLYFMLVIIIFFFPVVNFIQSAQGLYIILSVVLFDFIFKLLTRLSRLKDGGCSD